MKLKKKNCLIALIIVLLIVFELVNPFKLVSVYPLKKMNYSSKSASKIVEYGLKEDVLNREYSKFIDLKIGDKNFLIDNFDIYKELIYYEHFNDL